MKALLIIGILLIVVAFGLEYAGSQPLAGLSDRGEKVYTASIIIGFLLIGISSVMYLQKNNK